MCSQNSHIVESLLLEVFDVGICKSCPCFPHLCSNRCKHICISSCPHFMMVLSHHKSNASWRFKWHYRPLSVDKRVIVFLSLRGMTIVVKILECCLVSMEILSFPRRGWAGLLWPKSVFGCWAELQMETDSSASSLADFRANSSFMERPSIRTTSLSSLIKRSASLAYVFCIFATDFPGSEVAVTNIEF